MFAYSNILTNSKVFTIKYNNFTSIILNFDVLKQNSVQPKVC